MVSPLTVGSLFSGIGGFDLGLERAGMVVKWQCEIDEFCGRVLKKHWPDVPLYKDIKTLKGDKIETVDVIVGGFPCQPFSVAGEQKGKDDDRYLWPEMCRVISEVRPTWVIGENVAGIINMGLDQVLSDLENIGYSTEPLSISAVAVNAQHKRERLFILAHSECLGLEIASENRQGTKGFNGISNTLAIDTTKAELWGGLLWPGEPETWRVAHGIPNRVDRLKSLGNAIVPQIAEILGKAILRAEEEG